VGSNPTLSATPVPTFLSILFRPEITWRAIRAADPSVSRTFLTHAVPLSFLPSIAWPIGRALAGVAPSGSEIAVSFLSTLLLTLACVLLLASGIYLFATFFGARRNWRRSVAVSAYAATPVLLCGGFLVVPLLVIASVGGFLYGLGLCATGMRAMLDCKEGQAAAYVAAAGGFFGVSSMLLGALCSAAGLI
jgi:hypothetical protein